MMRIDKFIIRAILVVAGVVIIGVAAFFTGLFNLNHVSVFDYPNSEWVSADGEMTISISNESKYDRADFGTLTFNNDITIKQYGLNYWFGRIRIIAETSLPQDEENALVTIIGQFSTYYITDNHMIVCFSSNDDSSPYFDENVSERQQYVRFDRVE